MNGEYPDEAALTGKFSVGVERPDEAALTGKFSVGVERPQLQNNKVIVTVLFRALIGHR